MLLHSVCDNCTLTLLERTDDIAFMLSEGAGHLDVNAVPAPWIKLLTFDDNTKIISQDALGVTNAIYKLRNVDDNKIEMVIF